MNVFPLSAFKRNNNKNGQRIESSCKLTSSTSPKAPLHAEGKIASITGPCSESRIWPSPEMAIRYVLQLYSVKKQITETKIHALAIDRRNGIVRSPTQENPIATPARAMHTHMPHNNAHKTGEGLTTTVTAMDIARTNETSTRPRKGRMEFDDYTFAKMSVPFVPPKPKLFLTAY